MADNPDITVGPNDQFLSVVHNTPAPGTIRDQKKLIVMVHGFPGADKSGHGKLFEDLGQMFSAAGFHSLAFDFRGCGASEGQQEEFSLSTAEKDLEAVLGWAHTKGFEKIIYVAEGLGCASVLKKVNDSTALIFLFWPILDLKSYAETHWSGELQHSAAHGPHITFHDNRIGEPLIKEMKETDMRPYLSDLQVPLLMQYGEMDDVVGSAQIDFFRENTKGKRLDITGYQDGTHGLTNERHRQMVLYHIGQFFGKFV